MGRAELFPTDRGLQLRMALAAVLSPAIIVASLAAIVLLLPAKVFAGVVLAAAIGTAVTLHERSKVEHARTLSASQAPELHAIVERLCVVGDLPKPELVLDDERQPNSWVVDAPGRPPRVHVTKGLLDVLDRAELEAVLAHELAHVAHRDATVMTVVGLPGVALRKGANLRGLAGGWWPVAIGALLAGLVGAAAGLGTTTLSRHRELSADAAAARMTGRPSALASALMKMAGGQQRVPADDLRAVAARNAFHVLPVVVEHKGVAGWLLRRHPLAAMAATHPDVERRVAALAHIERQLQEARRGGGLGA